MLRDIPARAMYKGGHSSPLQSRIRQMENLQTTLFAVVALVIALGLIIGTLVVAPHYVVLAATIASLTYISGMVLMTIRG